MSVLRNQHAHTTYPSSRTLLLLKIWGILRYVTNHERGTAKRLSRTLSLATGSHAPTGIALPPAEGARVYTQGHGSFVLGHGKFVDVEGSSSGSVSAAATPSRSPGESPSGSVSARVVATPSKFRSAAESHSASPSRAPPASPSSTKAAVAAAAPWVNRLYVAAPAVTADSPTVADLLRKHRLLVNSSTTWTVVTHGNFFGMSHPWARGEIMCPGGCSVNWNNFNWAPHDQQAHVRIIHDDSKLSRIEPVREGQLVGLWAVETLNGDLQKRDFSHYDNYHTEMSYRTIGFHRDDYMSTFLPDMKVTGGVERLDHIRSWSDLYNAPVPFASKIPLANGTISWASRHCTSRSNREDLIRSLMNYVPVVVFGGNCLGNADHWAPAVASKSFKEQNVHMRHFLFHLAFENHNCVDYMTEKIYVAFLNGQVPILFGAPNAHEHTPPNSYIDATSFPDAEALADHLYFLERNPAEYAKYHAWRTASFETYGVFFRREFLRWVAVVHSVAGTVRVGIAQSIAFRCSMCYNLQEWATYHHWLPPFEKKLERHILAFNGSCTPGWSNATGFGRMPDGSAVIDAADFYGALNTNVPALHFEKLAAEAVEGAVAGSAP